jgi:hypothetical protein
MPDTTASSACLTVPSLAQASDLPPESRKRVGTHREDSGETLRADWADDDPPQGHDTEDLSETEIRMLQVLGILTGAAITLGIRAIL